MLIYKAIYVYLCVRSASCLHNRLDAERSEPEDDSESDDSNDSTKTKENEGIDFVRRHQEHRTVEEIDELTTPLNYPFVVSIHRKGPHYANGALVHKRWVISSAGEFYNVQESIKLFHVRLGTKNCKRGGTTSKIKAVQVHPSFEPGHPNFDLSLLLLAAPVTVSFDISPISLSHNTLDIINAELMSAYWSKVIVNGKLLPAYAKERLLSSSLRVSTLVVVPFADCASKVNGLQNSSFCVRPLEDYHSKCSPDAGAPVVVASDGLWGVTSGWKSTSCQVEPSPTIVTRVSPLSVRMWIDSQMLS